MPKLCSIGPRKLYHCEVTGNPAAGYHISRTIHGDRNRQVIYGTSDTIDDLAPQLGPINPGKLHHREVNPSASIYRKARRRDVPHSIHCKGYIIGVECAVDHLPPDLCPIYTCKLNESEVKQGARVEHAACSYHIPRMVYHDCICTISEKGIGTTAKSLAPQFCPSSAGKLN